MSTENAQHLEQDEHQNGKGHNVKIHVFATYTSTAASEKFHARPEDTVGDVINRAYKDLKEMQRDGDRYFGGDEPHRVDLVPYFNSPLADLIRQHVAVQPDHHHKGDYELAIEIEAKPGGA